MGKSKLKYSIVIIMIFFEGVLHPVVVSSKTRRINKSESGFKNKMDAVRRLIMPFAETLRAKVQIQHVSVVP